MADTAIRDALKAYGTINGTQWLEQLRAATRGEVGRAAMSTTGVNFHPQLVQTKQLRVVEDGMHKPDEVSTRTYGGFFLPVTRENREAFVRQLFANQQDKGQWFIDYLNQSESLATRLGLNTKTSQELLSEIKRTMTPQQQAFVQAYHDMQVAFLTPNQAYGFNMSAFTRLTADDTLTDKELYEIFAEQRFDRDLAAMGELGSSFIWLIGGELQGRIDFETDIRTRGIQLYGRYDTSEFTDYQLAARKAVAERVSIFANTEGLVDPQLSAIENAIRTMESRCSSLPDRQYIHR